MSAQFTISLSHEQIADALLEGWVGDEQLLDFVCQLDLRVADAGFTESLIKRLAVSLRGDLEPDEWLALLAEIAEPPK